MAVPWHRRLLLGDLSQNTGSAHIHKNVLAYFVTALLLTFAVSSPMLATDLFGPSPGVTPDTLNRGTVLILTAALFCMLISFFTTRIFLTLPARALGDTTLRFRDVWKRTTGNMWRLSFAGFLSAFLWIPVGVIAALFQSDPQSRWDSTIANCFIDIIAIVTALTFITFLSLAYRHFYMPVDHAAA